MSQNQGRNTARAANSALISQEFPQLVSTIFCGIKAFDLFDLNESQQNLHLYEVYKWLFLLAFIVGISRAIFGRHSFKWIALATSLKFAVIMTYATDILTASSEGWNFASVYYALAIYVLWSRPHVPTS